VHHSLGGNFALRRGRWKAIFAAGPGGGFSEPTIGALFDSGTGRAHRSLPWDAAHSQGQLYDLVTDPGEMHNRWTDDPAVVADLYEQLKTIVADPVNGLPLDVALC
jgi:arylsulfatase A-like enzyme